MTNYAISNEDYLNELIKTFPVNDYVRVKKKKIDLKKIAKKVLEHIAMFIITAAGILFFCSLEGIVEIIFENLI